MYYFIIFTLLLVLLHQQFVTKRNYRKQLQIYQLDSLRHRQEAETDYLTGLYNRKALELRINQILDNFDHIPDKHKIYHAILLLDMDHFKYVNDTYGHQSGDLLLQQISSILQQCIRSTDMLGRLGGDEFLIFLCHISNRDIALKKAQQICRTIEMLTCCQEAWNRVTVSIGIALVPQDGINFQQLYGKADHALYKAKHNGRNTYSI